MKSRLKGLFKTWCIDFASSLINFASEFAIKFFARKKNKNLKVLLKDTLIGSDRSNHRP